jgi:hypothetical protein
MHVCELLQSLLSCIMHGVKNYAFEHLCELVSRCHDHLVWYVTKW